jgi:hypothetical protein
MAEIVQDRVPKSAWYRIPATGEIVPALKFPAGYEDDHPKDFEPCEAPVAKVEATPADPAVASPPIAPAPSGIIPAILQPAPNG